MPIGLKAKMQGKFTTFRHQIKPLKLWNWLEYFQVALINQNYIDEEMEGRLNSQMACFSLVQSFFFPCAI